jgi:hypothetical protein
MSVGREEAPDPVPWKPKDALPPTGSDPFHEALVAVTVEPFTDSSAFHVLVMV